MTVCRSTLVSDRGEMDRARFLLNFSMERGVEKREPGERAKGLFIGILLIFLLSKHYRFFFRFLRLDLWASMLHYITLPSSGRCPYTD